ncbi:efflux RND transporter periplasmic adaptor subunit [Chryseobacterium sp. OV279]|uniref:efflux RND transporter periplasmic adaptor subunit n=1 Tax=Chryseobacterium sp. OV279 TaxID=1500285 RepID=UPI000912160E|nr:efflux RND transporter periplasmic adaptor subunit [Chryseobacterium sp. OV279]SHF87009.1 membrane fusion protein, multidrug efflux system [Chryseobacterium sp. OV279]
MGIIKHFCGTHKIYLGGILMLSFVVSACAQKEEKGKEGIPSIPIVQIRKENYQTEEHFPGVVSGVNNVEVRPQVSGYLDRILVDEGAYVKKGQLLFVIQEKTYQETFQSAVASKEMSQSALKKAQIEYDRIARLEQANVLSEVQLKTVKQELDYAIAAVRKAEANEKLASVNRGFTRITAPVNGYIGRLPYKKGALVGGSETEPLTVLSDISDVHVYFSMSEADFLRFKKRYNGASIEDKIKEIPPVKLELPDQSLFPETGKIDLILGQFDRQTASISFRATFRNPGSLLRSGNTGRVIIPKNYQNIIKVPQSATFKIQDKTMLYLMGKDRTVHLAPIQIVDKDTHNYLVSGGLNVGNRIVSKGADRLKEGQRINPVNE